MALVNKKFSDIITFSRASNATVTGSDGLIQYAPHNLLTYSQEFDNAAWVKSEVSAQVNTGVAPDGTVTAEKIVPSTTNSTHRVYQLATLTAGVSYTLSFYAKAAGETVVYVEPRDSAGLSTPASFNLSTGVVSGGINPTMTSVGDGWYRCTTGNNPSATGSGTQVLNIRTSSAYTGDGVSGIYLWGAQLSVGPRALSYTPTTSAAVYGPRFDYDPVSMAPKGLLVEEQRTNLLTYSEDFRGAAWTGGTSFVVSDTASSPSGETTADTFTTTVNGDSVSQVFTATGSVVASIFVKKGTTDKFRLRIDAATDYNGYFDLTTGTYDTINSDPGTSIVAYPNGWYRCSVTGASTTPVKIAYYTAQFSGYTTGSVYLWGAQLEVGAFATSYIPTVASQVTRSADVASVNTLSPWYNQTAGTLYAEASTFGDASVRYIANYNDNTTSNRLAQYFGASTFIGLVTTGGVSQANLSISGTLNVKHALAYAANDFITAANGTLSGADTSGTVPTVSQMNIGSGPSSASPINGHIRRIAYYPRRLTNSELQALTA